MDKNSLEELAKETIFTARKASEKILDIYAQDFSIWKKDDNSPVTEADQYSNDIIISDLTRIDQTIPIISEEQDEHNLSENSPYFWLVDPLDGTKEFINKNDEFAINIALIHEQTPLFGLTHSPISGFSYIGYKDVAYKQKDNDRKSLSKLSFVNEKECQAVTSRSHRQGEKQEAFLSPYFSSISFQKLGSSLKFAKIAEGKGDVYVRFGPTCEWDTASGHALLKAVGGDIVDHQGKPLLYKKKSFINQHFIAGSKKILKKFFI